MSEMPSDRCVNGTTRRVVIDGTKMYITTARRPNEHGIYERICNIKIAKEGSTLSGFCRSLSQIISNAATSGDEELRRCLSSLVGQQFSPYGVTTDPVIPVVSSICDYIARRLEIEWLS